MKVFISYASKDLNEAEKICSYLESYGKMCWIAPRNIAVGKEYGEEIIKGIESSDVFVLVYSMHSNSSPHVLREVERAVGKKIPVICYALDKTPMSKSMEYFLLSTQFLNAARRDTTSLQLLNESLDKFFTNTNSYEKSVSATTHKPHLPVWKKRLVALGMIVIVAIATVGLVIYGKNTRSKPEPDTGTKISGNGAVQTGSEKGTTSSDSSDVKFPEVQTGVSVFEAGDYIQFGRYYPPGYSKEFDDGEISWVITDINEQTGELTLVSQYILDIMPYDTAESGRFDRDKAGNSYDRNIRDTYSFEQMTEFRGNSAWETSNIRTWLNSDKASVKYDDSAPQDRGSDEHANGYNARSGFLHDFHENELAILQEKTIRTTMNALEPEADKNEFTLSEGTFSEITAGTLYKTTTDRVYLLSIEEVKEYADKGIFQPFTKPTASAAASDKSSWLKFFNANGHSNYIWCTRTPVSTASELVIVIYTGKASFEFKSYYAAASGFGLRPAIVIKPAAFTLQGEGTSQDPYILKLQ